MAVIGEERKKNKLGGRLPLISLSLFTETTPTFELQYTAH
jgi:hypothetical protein